MLATSRNAAEARLWHHLTEVVLAGGKRLRPYLITLTYEAFGGSQTGRVIDVAAGWELLHQAMLIHDDIIDRDYTRHAQLNVAGRLQKEYKNAATKIDRDHYANSGALLAGDLALSSAYQLIFNAGFPSSVTRSVTQLLGSSIAIVIGGELLDTEAVMEPLGSTDSLLIADLKTASYSFVGPLQCGAILAGASQQDIKKLGEIGSCLGIAFQLSDDVLGLFGDEKITGKSNSSDVHEGKRTILVQYTLDACTPEQKSFVTKVLGNPEATAQQVSDFRDLVESTGARAKTEDLIGQQLDRADAALDELAISDRTFIEQYELIVTKLRQRKS